MTGLKNVEKFPTKGKKNRNGEFDQLKQITYKCNPFEEGAPNRCLLGAIAYTVIPAVADKGQGWATHFCPKFFEELKYINSFERRADPSSMRYLASYEQSMIHELMHADVIGTPAHMDDIWADFPGVGRKRAYGATLASRFAWLNVSRQVPTVNVFSRLNADNYAWYYSNLFFGDKW